MLIEDYIRAGFKLLPIHTPNSDGTCSCGREGCAAVGKHPRTKNGVKDATASLTEAIYWHQEGHNIAVACGTELPGGGYLCVLDIDIRNGGDDSLRALELEHGQLPDTFRQITGGGGYHYFFRSQSPIGCAVLAPGVDLKGDGGYVLLAPSLHKSGKKYEWDVATDFSFADAPKWISAPTAKPRPEYLEDDPVSTYVGRVCEKMGWLGDYLGKGKRAVQCPWQHEHSSDGWHSRSSGTVLLPATKNGDAFGGWKCMHEHCRKRGVQDVLNAATEEAKLYARSFFPVQLLPKQVQQVRAQELLGYNDLMGKFSGDEYKIDAVESNVAKILDHGPWKDVLSWDEMTSQVLIQHQPPFDTPWGYVYPRPWQEEDLRATQYWLQTGPYPAKWSTEMVQRGAEMVAQNFRVNGLTDYLSSLKWDGYPRVDTWLLKALGCDDTPYNRQVGRMWLISAVARAFQAGVQADYVLVLEGGQGVGKSRALKILGDEFFTDDLGDINSKDACERIRGKWIVEDSEMTAFKRVNSGAAKSFITRRADRYRPAYGRNTVEVPRRCVFAVSINDPVYLDDPTGARRFWSVRVRAIDCDWLQENRDQLWAEAKKLYQDGEPWYPDSVVFPGTAKVVQEERFVDDPWEAILKPYLTHPVIDTEALYAALGLEITARSTSTERRLANILHRRGYTVTTTGGKKAWVRR